MNLYLYENVYEFSCSTTNETYERLGAYMKTPLGTIGTVTSNRKFYIIELVLLNTKVVKIY
jgi:hypothetical protein